MAISPDYVLSRDYEERVYAGVLGKIIGVYLGRPFEGWSHEDIEKTLGEVSYYVHEKFHAPLIVTDDDISGTFTFVRALAENGHDPDLTAAQIGDWWLNTIIENKTILWWGGMGMSTEQTAFLRLKAGLKAPASGSIAANGAVVAEQIGSQIFIDGWGMICPGDPAQAADFARKAASVSHDGEAIYGAQVVAALVSQAFIEPDWSVLLDTAAGFIPRDSLIYRLIGDVRAWAAQNGDDWRATLQRIQRHYGYDKFGGSCHIVPNHAVVLLALLHGRDDFGRALMIANTAGWDTDCNSGNVGCILGIKNGLAGIDAGPDWRGPVADRLYLPTADGGRAITDAVRETYALVDSGRALAGQAPTAPKHGARFHFSLPGAVQGFVAEASPEVRGTVTVGHCQGKLELRLHRLATGRAARAATATFAPPEALTLGGYELVASPTLYSGQTVTAAIEAGPDLTGPITLGLFARVYGDKNELALLRGPAQRLAPGEAAALAWTLPETDGSPLAEIGLEMVSSEPVNGCLLLDYLTWAGTPNLTLGRARGDGWQRTWVNGTSQFQPPGPPSSLVYRIIQNEGTGLVTQGEQSWTEYTVSTDILPHLANRVGLVAAVRGLRRYVALLLDSDGKVRLIEQRDDTRRVLAESEATWAFEQPASLSLTISAGNIAARFDRVTLTAVGKDIPTRGAIGLLVEAGHAEFGSVRVTPARR